MADFISPIIDNVLDILQKYTPGLLPGREPFSDYRKSFTGVVQNFPAVYAMPVRTTFDPESMHTRHQAHQITIKFAISASDPDTLTAEAGAYMAALDGAIQSATVEDWQGTLPQPVVMRVFVQAHDYGPLFERGVQLARFPELELIVETEEL
jgi:hypothetical protein